VRGAVAVLERRGRWAGKARPNQQTTRSWLRGALVEPSDDDADLDRLSRMAEWAAYAPDEGPPWPETEVLAVCRRVVGGWTLKRWRDSTSIPAVGA
jgi:hypothetical protein